MGYTSDATQNVRGPFFIFHNAEPTPSASWTRPPPHSCSFSGGGLLPHLDNPHFSAALDTPTRRTRAPAVPSVLPSLPHPHLEAERSWQLHHHHHGQASTTALMTAASLPLTTTATATISTFPLSAHDGSTPTAPLPALASAMSLEYLELLKYASGTHASSTSGPTAPLASPHANGRRTVAASTTFPPPPPPASSIAPVSPAVCVLSEQADDLEDLCTAPVQWRRRSADVPRGTALAPPAPDRRRSHDVPRCPPHNYHQHIPAGRLDSIPQVPPPSLRDVILMEPLSELGLLEDDKAAVALIAAARPAAVPLSCQLVHTVRPLPNPRPAMQAWLAEADFSVPPADGADFSVPPAAEPAVQRYNDGPAGRAGQRPGALPELHCGGAGRCMLMEEEDDGSCLLSPIVCELLRSWSPSALREGPEGRTEQPRGVALRQWQSGGPCVWGQAPSQDGSALRLRGGGRGAAGALPAVLGCSC